MQESFQLAHETLYLAVVMTDLYMSKKGVRRDEMQLIGATAILLSSKFYVSCYFAYHMQHLLCYNSYHIIYDLYAMIYTRAHGL